MPITLAEPVLDIAVARVIRLNGIMFSQQICCDRESAVVLPLSKFSWSSDT